jgi:type I restriction enzyme S subunit
MEVRSGYKKTDVGVIPKQWGVRRIADLASVSSGGTPSRAVAAYWNGSIPWITTSQIEFGTIDQADQFITDKGLKSSAAKLLPVGTLLIALYGQGKTRGKVGVLGIAAATNQACAAIELNNEVSREFILQYLISKYQEIRNSSNSGSQENLSGQIVKNLLVALPELEEQHAIAEALSAVDALLAGLDRLIAKKRDLKQAAMQQLLTGQTRLPGFQGEWEVKTVADLENQKVVKLSRGQVISKRDINRMSGDFPIYSSSIHNDGLFGCYGNFMFDEELITWSVDGGGNFFHRRKHKFSVTNVCGFMRVDTAKIDYRFLAAQLQLLHSRKSFDYQSKAHPSVIRKEYEVRLPPLPEQRALAAVLADMDAELAALEARREKTRALKQGMMQELLTGRTRLV